MDFHLDTLLNLPDIVADSYPKRLSLDEFARRKGQGNFATTLTDLDKISLLEVIDSHKSDDIIAVLKQQLTPQPGVR